MILFRWNARWLQWLRPGLNVKRWILLFAIGMALFFVGALDVVRWLTPDLSLSAVLERFDWPRWLIAVPVMVLGIALIAAANIKLNLALLSPFTSRRGTNLLNELETHYNRKKGPKIVAIGGGTGLSTFLRGLKLHTSNIVAIVTVADDGGSSGRLRKELGVLPPGDFRQCIAALAEDEALMTALFQYRFAEGHSLKGHAFGNLFIAAMAEVTGDFPEALLEAGRVLSIRGRILPSTLAHVTLCADVRGEGVLQRTVGEHAIPESGLPIERVFLEPERPQAYPEAVRAILDADLVIAGPGSLYTSVMPNLLVPEIAQALRHTPAPKLYIANVATQLGETIGYTIHDHIHAIEKHIGPGIFDYMLVNDNLTPQLPANYTIQLLTPNGEGENYRVVRADVVDNEKPWRHDSRKLAKAVMNFFEAYQPHARPVITPKSTAAPA